MNHKNLIIILSVVVIILSICVGVMFLNNNNHAGITYENYTVNGTGTTIEIPVNSKIVESDKLINITNDENVYVLIYKDTDESKTATMAANTDIMDEKLNKETKELVQVFSYDDEARNHVMNSIKFGKPIKTIENKTTEIVSKEVDHSQDPVYCSLCGAYVVTQYEIDHAPGAGYFHDPSTGKTICNDCAAKLMEEDEAYNNDYEFGEQDDGSYIDADGNYWGSYDEYLYANNHPAN